MRRAVSLLVDGVTLRGATSTILTNDRGWEGALVEGPWIVEEGGSFYLFYSGNAYASASYAAGEARASSPLGPYEKAAAPILGSNRRGAARATARSCAARAASGSTSTTRGAAIGSARRRGGSCSSIASSGPTAGRACSARRRPDRSRRRSGWISFD